MGCWCYCLWVPFSISILSVKVMLYVKSRLCPGFGDPGFAEAVFMDPHGAKHVGTLHKDSDTALARNQASRAFCGMFGVTAQLWVRRTWSVLNIIHCNTNSGPDRRDDTNSQAAVAAMLYLKLMSSWSAVPLRALHHLHGLHKLLIGRYCQINLK